MEPRSKFVLKLGLCLVAAFLVSECLTRYLFYPTAPITRLSFRVWLAQTKEQVRDLSKISPRKLFSRQPRLAPPVSFPPAKPIPLDPTPRPSQPHSSPKTTPTSKPSFTPSPPPGYSPHPTPLPPTPTAIPTPIPTPTPYSSPPPIENQAIALVEAINQERARQGLNSLTAPDLLMQVAQAYVKDLDGCKHGVPGKGYIWDYAKRAGYQGTGFCEVIACGAISPENAVSMWMSSTQGHRECIMNSSGKSVGAGVWQGYWLAGVFK